MTSNIKIGDIFTSKNFGDFEVVKYINAHNVIVKFIETGYVTSVQAVQIKLLNITDKYKPSVYGVGVIDVYRDWETDRKSTRLNSSHSAKSRMPSSA